MLGRAAEKAVESSDARTWRALPGDAKLMLKPRLEFCWRSHRITVKQVGKDLCDH